MNKRIVLFLFIITIFQNLTCNGQNLPDSTKTYRIETRDGNIFIGSVVAEDSLTFVLKTQHLGEIEIPRNFIKSTTRLKEVKEVGGAIWLPNPQASRYYWAPNGYGLEKGTSYYQNIWILYNQFSAGITNNFSIGAGMLPLFLFAGASTPLWIVPKFSIPVVENKVNIGTGAFLGTILGEQTGLFGLLYGTTTLGSRDKNISLGLAYGFADGQWQKAPVINISSLIRTGSKAYFITENYAITIDQKLLVLISAGGRSIIRNIGLDYSLWIPIGSVLESFVAIPFLGVTIPIGKKN